MIYADINMTLIDLHIERPLGNEFNTELVTLPVHENPASRTEPSQQIAEVYFCDPATSALTRVYPHTLSSKALQYHLKLEGHTTLLGPSGVSLRQRAASNAGLPCVSPRTSRMAKWRHCSKGSHENILIV